MILTLWCCLGARAKGDPSRMWLVSSSTRLSIMFCWFVDNDLSLQLPLTMNKHQDRRCVLLHQPEFICPLTSGSSCDRREAGSHDKSAMFSRGCVMQFLNLPLVRQRANSHRVGNGELVGRVVGRGSNGEVAFLFLAKGSTGTTTLGSTGAVG